MIPACGALSCDRCGEGPPVYRTPTGAVPRSLTANPSKGERPGFLGSGTRGASHWRI